MLMLLSEPGARPVVVPNSEGARGPKPGAPVGTKAVGAGAGTKAAWL